MQLIRESRLPSSLNRMAYLIIASRSGTKYSKTGIVDCVVSDSPDGTVEVPEGGGLKPSDREKRKDVYVSYVNIGLSNGIKIDHHRLSYGELVCFINKLQALCSL